MKQQTIRDNLKNGTCDLILKFERQQAYNLGDSIVRVVGWKDRPGYAVPFVVALSSAGFAQYFKPADFARIATPADYRAVDNANQAVNALRSL